MEWGTETQKLVLLLSHVGALAQNSVFILVRKERFSLSVISVECFLFLFLSLWGSCVFRILLASFCFFLVWGYLEQTEGRRVPMFDCLMLNFSHAQLYLNNYQVGANFPPLPLLECETHFRSKLGHCKGTKMSFFNRFNLLVL